MFIPRLYSAAACARILRKGLAGGFEEIRSQAIEHLSQTPGGARLASLPGCRRRWLRAKLRAVAAPVPLTGTSLESLRICPAVDTARRQNPFEPLAGVYRRAVPEHPARRRAVRPPEHRLARQPRPLLSARRHALADGPGAASAGDGRRRPAQQLAPGPVRPPGGHQRLRPDRHVRRHRVRASRPRPGCAAVHVHVRGIDPETGLAVQRRGSRPAAVGPRRDGRLDRARSSSATAAASTPADADRYVAEMVPFRRDRRRAARAGAARPWTSLRDYIDSVELRQATPAARDAIGGRARPAGPRRRHARAVARPGAGRRRHAARLGARDVRLCRAAARSDGAGVGAPAARRARPGVRVAARRARGAGADRAAHARLSKPTPQRRDAAVARSAAARRAGRLALRIGGRYVARSPRLLFASVERRQRAAPRPRPALGRRGRRGAGLDEGRADEARPDGELHRRGHAADVPRRDVSAAAQGAADEPGASRRR